LSKNPWVKKERGGKLRKFKLKKFKRKGGFPKGPKNIKVGEICPQEMGKF